MRGSSASIATTLLAIITALNLLIAAPVVYNVYQSWGSYRKVQTLQSVAAVANHLLEVKKFLSLERGASVAIIAAPEEATPSLLEELRENRRQADALLGETLGIVRQTMTSDLVVPMERVEKSYGDLRQLRKELDGALERARLAPKPERADAKRESSAYRKAEGNSRSTRNHSGNAASKDAVPEKPKNPRDSPLPGRFFAASTAFITDIHTLNENYTLPYYDLDAEISKQLRFSHVVWQISEYTGREYALLGELIVENRFAPPAMQEELSLWRGRVRYAWELVHDAVLNYKMLAEVKPMMDEAETHYSITFDRIKDIFRQPATGLVNPDYPITIQMWLELASQAVDTLHTMNDGVIRLNQSYIEKIKQQAMQDIMLYLLLFASTLALSFMSWRLISRRVVYPVNAMANALYRATQGQYDELPPIAYQHDEIGKLASALHVFRDNARQLHEERDKAQAANVAKSEFLANMSHEIRTPMNVVLGLSHILAKTTPLTDRQAEFIKTLRLSAEALLAIINDLMDFSKIETGGFELEKIPFDLFGLIEEIVALMSVKTKEKKLEFVTDIGVLKGKEFTGDPTRVRQVLTNICGNAVKFTERGSVTLKAEWAPNPQGDHADVFITVTDTGIGIPPGKIDYIFEKFTQADSSIGRKYGGTGLGLAIAKTFAEMMDGKITVTSVVGKGSVFTVQLPLPVKPQDPAVLVEETPHAVNGRADRNDRRILMVEDFEPNAMVAGEYLKEFGFDFDLAETGFDAIEKVKRRKYHAILMDIQMHGLDGYKTTEAIRRFEKGMRREASRIIGMTAHALPGDKEKCLASGMDDYLPKPFNPEDLRAKLVTGKSADTQ
ncbi:MAG: ATP-binding protein [Alphaproteobacteria bacterium]